MPTKINTIQIETGDPTTNHNLFYPVVVVRRGAHWYTNPDGSGGYNSGNSRSHYEVTPSSLMRCFRALMTLEARNRPERQNAIEMERLIKRGKREGLLK